MRSYSYHSLKANNEKISYCRTVSKQPAGLTAQIVDPDPALREQTARSVLSDRKWQIQYLLAAAAGKLEEVREDNRILMRASGTTPPKSFPALVDDYQRKVDVAATVIRLLGRLRAVEAVPLLVDNLVDFRTGLRHSMREGYPCLGALIDIGTPAFGPLIAKAVATDDGGDRRLSELVFINVVRRDAAIAYIKSQAPSNQSATQQKRLDTLLQEMSGLPDSLIN